MAKEKKSSGLKERDKQIIIIILMAALLFVSFKLSTGTFADKNDQLDKEIKKLTVKRDELLDAESRREEIEKDTKVKMEEYKLILGKFPEKTSMEKIIEYLCGLYQNHQFGVNNLSKVDNGIFYTFVDNEGKENPQLGSINSTTVTCNYVGDYKELKSLFDEINIKCPTKVNITSVSLSRDDAVGGISGQFVMDIYTGFNITKYEEPDFGVDTGKSNVFGDN